ncbi:leucine-rich_repeat domain-containing protein [Hexamita inflata]|uniref:Leucine-rich repeat domain-containing protein n=1 Tax=Hexamita inflata TaxID=28002 RepID=A0AA86U1E6_9EUKA|nr:leucine-rich repeat domain-containing protein [Hexamita inflata]
MLDLSFNRNIDVSPLQHLSQLQKLILKSCNLSSVRALQHIITLEYLDLSGNRHIDVIPLKYLPILSELLLNDCALSDIFSLTQNCELNELNNNNLITYSHAIPDIFAHNNDKITLDNCQQIYNDSIYSIQHNQHFNVEIPFQHLNTLSLKNNFVKTSQIKRLKNLLKLDISECELKNITQFKFFSMLKITQYQSEPWY